MQEKKQKTFLFLLAQITTTYRHQHRVHERCNGALLGEENACWDEGDTHMGQLSWWSDVAGGGGVRNGCVGC